MNAPDPRTSWWRWLDRIGAGTRVEPGPASGEAADVAASLSTARSDAEVAVRVRAPPAWTPLTPGETELGEGDVLGAWRLLRCLGSGGMGAVYLAERADGHFQQQAAVKLVRMQAPRDAFGYFARERQILATLQHPHIARLLDGGATPGGQPYLVMEYVEGVPIDVYCREHTLDLTARLKLFQEVCAAVQFAHQRLIVHCDLKPSNVLVRADGTPVLLDFGIARALDHPGATARGDAAYFTPDYASPEQLRGEAVTTAADIHALGLILFELVSGRKARGPDDARSITVPTPSVLRPSQLADAVPWRGRLRGDLDAIVMRATAERASDRYSSALALSADIQRFRHHQPVLARPHTLAYLSVRLARRRWAFALAALFGALLLGVVAWRLVAERDRARAAERDAQAEAHAASQVSDFLVSVFGLFSPEGTSDTRSASTRQVLDQGTARIQSGLAGTPHLKAKLLYVLATAYRRFGEPRRAIELLREAIGLYTDPAVNQPLAAAQALSELAVVYVTNSFPPRDAVAVAQRSLALRQRHAAGDALGLAESWNALGLAFDSDHDYPAAEAALDRALTLQREHTGAETIEIAATLNNLGLVADHRGNTPRALAYYEQALDLNRQHGGEHTAGYQASLQGYAVALAHSGQRTGALALLEQNLALTRELYADISVQVAQAHSELGASLQGLGRLREAVVHYRAALHIDAAATGVDSAAYALPLVQLGCVYEDMGDFAQAIPLVEQALAIRSKLRSADDVMVLRARLHLGRALTAAGRLAEAKPQLDAAVSGFRAHADQYAVNLAEADLVQAQWQLHAGDLHGAAGTLALLQRSGAALSPLMQAQRDALGADLAAAHHEAARALALRQSALQTMRQAFGDTHPLTAEFALDYAEALRQAGRVREAEAIVAPLREVIQATFAATSPVRRLLAQWP